MQELGALQELLSSPGWDLLVEVVEAQTSIRKDVILLTALETSDKVYAQEFMKGEVAGMRLLVQLPKDIVDSTQAKIAELKQRISSEE